MTKNRVGFRGFVTAVPTLPAELKSNIISKDVRSIEVEISPLLGSIPKSNISTNFPQIILDFCVLTSLVIVIITVALYSWSVYCEREYQGIAKITNAIIFEEIPPVDPNHLLNRSELLYCLAENKRLESQKTSLNRMFLFWKSDYFQAKGYYDLVCIQKKYRKGDLVDVDKIYKENLELYRRQGTLR